MKNKKILKLCFLSLFSSLAIIFSYVEFLLPSLSYIAPGIKMGFANIAIIIVLYSLGNKEAFIVSAVRVLIVSLLFGSFSLFIYSITGAIFSLGLMCILKLIKCSKIFVSIIGGIIHNLSQIFLFFIISKTSLIFSYTPILIISGLLAGLAVGIVSVALLRIIEKTNPIKKWLQ